MRNLLTTLLMTMLIGGCAVGPDYQRPGYPVPPDFRGAGPGIPADPPQLPSGTCSGLRSSKTQSSRS
jgi:multidrug efflux system outer membrane protein